MSPAAATRVSAPSTTCHPAGIESILKPRQPAVVLPSNSSRQPAARSAGDRVLGDWADKAGTTAGSRTSTAVAASAAERATVIVTSGLGGLGGRRVGEQHYGLNTGSAMNLVVGRRARRSLTLTAEHVKSYAALTGDYNPLHFDAAFAHRTKFGRLVVQGGLTTGLLHALVAMDLPGPGTVFLSQNWKFTAPVYLGDTITAEAEVVSVHPTKPVCQLRVVIKREDREMVLEGEAWCYTLAAKDDPS